MRLAYHQELFDKLGLTPSFSAEQAALVLMREERCRSEFPASVREWFSIEGVFELFRSHTKQDELVTNTTMAWREQLAALGDPEEVAKGYLCVAVENQA